MTRIILSGCCGRMGKNIVSTVNERDNCEIVAGIDIVDDSTLGFPVFQNYSEVDIKADVVVDFSNPALLPYTLEYAKKNSVAAVIATTGLSDDDIKLIKDCANYVPVFFTFNMSLGINLLCELSKTAAKVLGDNFDIEIVEAHHNQKLDAPSGTAIMLADNIKNELSEDTHYVYDRQCKREKREHSEIGIHSIRGGNIVGEHEVIFAGTDEVIKLSHSARSKMVFANGAVNAVVYVAKQKAGLYDMSDLIND